MNNAKIASVNLGEEKEVDMSPWLRTREKELLEIIEAIQAISASNYWKVLERSIFSGLVETINKRLANEKDDKELYRLQGQMVWAMKYRDFGSLAEAFRNELTGIRVKLHGKN